MTKNNDFMNAYEQRGTEAVLTLWKERFAEDRHGAFELVNDPDIAFPILYSLAPELIGMHDQLTVKNQLAINHIFSVLNGDPFGILDDIDLFDQYHYCAECFSWMVKTGGSEMVDEKYPNVIDHACTLLLLHFKMDCLSDIVDILFYRHRNKGQRHYILSTFYNAEDPRGLIYVAKYLRSDDAADVTLAKSILSFIPEVAHTPPAQCEHIVLSWLEENRDYLVYTAENNDSHPRPVPFQIHFPAKYIGIPVETTTGNLLFPVEDTFFEKYRQFQSLSLHLQNLLSYYSLKLRRWNREEWKRWMQIPLEDQTSFIQQRGSYYDYY